MSKLFLLNLVLNAQQENWNSQKGTYLSAKTSDIQVTAKIIENKINTIVSRDFTT